VFTRAVTGKNQGLSKTNPFLKDFQGVEFRERKNSRTSKDAWEPL